MIMKTYLNYLIKGENLKVLKSLLPYYKEKVKLIYIDPPYNTGGDGFKYNDNFNHSTWLTFMKNRLEIARELLADDGVIFVQIDDNEQAYLKVLMDEVFGRENVDCMIWNKEAEGKSGTLKQVDRFRNIHEYILIGFFNKNNTSFSKINEALKGKENELSTANLAANKGKENKNHSNYFTINAPNGQSWLKQWKFDYDTIQKYLKDNLVYFGKSGNNQPRLILPMDDRRTIFSTSILSIGSTTQGRDELENLGVSREDFSTPKPEALLERIIQIATKERDIVLDFFAGSGTTGAVAHKMGRRWIMIEQMDYIETITKVRLQKVLEGEQGGVSKNHKWQGGGSFEYLVL